MKCAFRTDNAASRPLGIEWTVCGCVTRTGSSTANGSCKQQDARTCANLRDQGHRICLGMAGRNRPPIVRIIHLS